MPSITQYVEEYVATRPFVEEALIRGIINYKKLAIQINEELEISNKTNTKDPEAAIMMALRRLTQRLSTSFQQLNNASSRNDGLRLFNSKYGLYEFTIERKEGVNEKIKQLYDLVKINKGEFLTVTQGIYEITIISHQEYETDFKKIFELEDIIKEVRNLASISLQVPETAVDTEGLFYNVTKSLYWANINVVEIVSTFTEMTYILREIDLPRAQMTLRKLLG